MSKPLGRYWAATGIGWGRGNNIDEALMNYNAAQRRNFPKAEAALLAESWGFVWHAPEGTTGFFNGPEGMWWSFDDKDSELVDGTTQRVFDVGNVPAQFSVNPKEDSITAG